MKRTAKGMGVEMSNDHDASVNSAAEMSLLDGDESVMNTPANGRVSDATKLWQDAVYECCETALWRKQLVLTPHMLLDRLKVCADLLSEVRGGSTTEEARDHQIACVSEEIDHLLHLLWRGGLWTNVGTVEKTACDGQAYHVLAEPFTDGKPQGKPLSADAPEWLKEVLGVRLLGC
ncbi:MAG: hypothetical protein H8F28_10145 [Fibrella sp.]|nr:hypothetical protein [Armatimonadota bacterium]